MFYNFRYRSVLLPNQTQAVFSSSASRARLPQTTVRAQAAGVPALLRAAAVRCSQAIGRPRKSFGFALHASHSRARRLSVLKTESSWCRACSRVGSLFDSGSKNRRRRVQSRAERSGRAPITTFGLLHFILSCLQEALLSQLGVRISAVSLKNHRRPLISISGENPVLFFSIK